MPSGCPHTIWSIPHSMGLHTYLLHPTMRMCLVPRPSLIKVRGKGPGEQMLTWGGSCCSRTEGRRLRQARPGWVGLLDLSQRPVRKMMGVPGK